MALSAEIYNQPGFETRSFLAFYYRLFCISLLLSGLLKLVRGPETHSHYFEKTPLTVGLKDFREFRLLSVPLGPLHAT